MFHGIFFLPAAVLLPLILGAIILITKKAAFLSKLALFISGFFGVGGLAAGLGGLGGLGSGGGYGYGHQGGFGGVPFGGQFGGHNPLFEGGLGSYKVLENNTPRNQEDGSDNFYEYDKKHLLKDRASRLYERESDVGRHHVQEITSKHKPSNQRTFVWATTSQN